MVFRDFHITFANGIIQIQFAKQFNGAFKGIIVDASGRVMYKFTDISKNGTAFNFNVPHGLKGLYLLKLQAGNESLQKKIILN